MIWIKIDPSNAAFDGDNREEEIRNVISKLDFSNLPSKSRDTNGNTCCEAAYTTEAHSDLFKVQFALLNGLSNKQSLKDVVKNLRKIFIKYDD